MSNYLKKNNQPNDRKNHSQYYTTDTLGQTLIKSIPENLNIKKAIDLSAGEGNLLQWCKNRFPKCYIHGFDIDVQNIKILRNKNIPATLVDSTTAKIDSLICKEKKFCLSIGNPPFKNLKNNEHIRKLFLSYDINTGDIVRAENYFLLYSLHIVKNNGMVVFIIPESIISGEKNKEFRTSLSSHFNIKEVMEIPRGIFIGTEAKTFIISIIKNGCTSKIKLSNYEKTKKTLEINKENFIERADFKYYDNLTQPNVNPSLKLKILRGNLPGKLAKSRPENAIHTTSFCRKDSKLNIFSNSETETDQSDGYIRAYAGDILIPRVGSRSLGKVGVIEKGVFKPSDCIFLIRPENKKQQLSLLKFLNSPQGCEFIFSISKGTGASYITLKDIKLLKNYI